MEKTKILIIDDEVSICESLSYILENHGYQVVTSSKGSDALEEAKKIEFNVVLIDIKLPDLDGLEILKIFKDKYPDMTCIIITGYASVHNAVQALKEGADDYFIKPASTEEILLRIEESLKRQRMKLELKESQERYRLIIENANDLIDIMNENHKIEYVNKKVHELTLGYSSNELIGKLKSDLIHPDDLKRAKAMLKECFEKREGMGEYRIKHKNNHYLWVEMKGNTFVDKNGNKKGIFISRNITERKAAEEEVRKRMLKFKIEDGNVYLAREITPTLSLEVFKELLKMGYEGYIISRTPPEKFEDTIDLYFEHYWLSEKGEENCITNLDGIEQIYATLPQKSVILFDRLEYIAIKYGFEKLMSLIQSLSEITYLEKRVFILSIDPDTISQQDLRILEKETKEIEPRHLAKIPEDMLVILRFIYKENSMGNKPSYSDVGEVLRLSRPTIRKKIKQLVFYNYVVENSKGRKKVLELQEKGKGLFLG